MDTSVFPTCLSVQVIPGSGLTNDLAATRDLCLHVVSTWRSKPQHKDVMIEDRRVEDASKCGHGDLLLERKELAIGVYILPDTTEQRPMAFIENGSTNPASVASNRPRLKDPLLSPYASSGSPTGREHIGWAILGAVETLGPQFKSSLFCLSPTRLSSLMGPPAWEAWLLEKLDSSCQSLAQNHSFLLSKTAPEQLHQTRH
ncbi:hypothetical protein B0H67DRAFT_5471 [Lasiosphaeris hirsuta]|uniref:Uncharacterized protein n=1 Tax=Lasiosphaeris hirsuta TaxID=260670 RepID=A0AA40E661_9PEZI|nr:hypothetical protein B0H67DRAFT_5471 [Lasiosphaeris hirsuta]